MTWRGVAVESLYEITQNIGEFAAAVANGDIPEEAVADTLMALEGQLESKIEGCACWIKNQTALVESMQSEAKALMDRISAKNKSIERLKKSMITAMQTLDRASIETPKCAVRIRKGVEKVEIENVQAFINWAERNNMDMYLSYSVPTPNRTEIRKAIADGNGVAFCKLVRFPTINIK